MPVGNGGKFTPEAKAIYELVHEMQRLSFEALRPSVHWDDIHLQCHRTLVRGFQRLGIFKTPESDGGSGSWNSEDAILASGISIAFFPHGLGHSLGMDVHDVPSASKPVRNYTTGKNSGPPEFFKWLRLRLPLEVGMVVVGFSPSALISFMLTKCIRLLNPGFISRLIYWLPSEIQDISITMYSKGTKM
jgi:Xaa-Pro dipeptidase